MESLKRKAGEVSLYLQRLMAPTVLSEVQAAVSRKDTDSFVKACRKVKIPAKYIAVLIAILLTVAPLQWEWP